LSGQKSPKRQHNMEKKEYSSQRLITELSIRILAHLKEIRAFNHKSNI
jgi:hypothetical protein